MSDQVKNATDGKTPLQRYLDKQRQTAPVEPAPVGAATVSPSPSHRAAAPESRAREGRPVETAGFGARLVAYALDACIVTAISTVLGSIAGLALFFLPEVIQLVFKELVRLAVMFFYYGWFYGERGATPGKMLLHLRVVEIGSGKKIGYWRAFLRETVGKLISGAVLGVGFLIVLARVDKLALHDLIFDTRVVQDQ